MEFRLLGPVEVRHDGRSVALGAPRQQALLAALLLNANVTVSLDQLIAAVWETPPRAPESNVRTFVARLRLRFRELGLDSRLSTGSAGYQLRVLPGELDVDSFRDLAGRGEQALLRGDLATAATQLGAALKLWRGPPLGGVATGPLLQAEVARWHDLRVTVAERYAAARIEANAPEAVIGDLRILLAMYPFREQLWVALIRALHRSGRQSEALDAFSRVRQVLVDELGIEPGAALRRVHFEVLTDVPAAAQPAAPPVAATEVNAWRQLPMDIVRFTGRDKELRRLRELVVTRKQPIVVIEGMAGVGKTSLAVHFAHQLVAAGRFDEIQLWTDLHGFDLEHQPADPAAVLDGFLRLLGFAGEVIPHDPQSRAALLRDRLAGRRVLILLDNARTPEQVRPLLPGTTDSLVLITSRRDLSKLDETRVVPLDVLAPEESVTVLSTVVDDGRVAHERAAAARVAELCGHLPLAVVLAGRRLQSRPAWTVLDLVRRLERGKGHVDSLYPGLGVLRTVFDLSYRALSPARRRMFQVLGQHPGGDFTAADAAALAGTSPLAAEDQLEALLDEHLIQQATAGRYRFHDLMREFARERAEPADKHAAAQRLLAWYLHAAESARGVVDPHRVRIIRLPELPAGCEVPEFAGPETAFGWFESERANLLAAVRFAYESGIVAEAWQLPWVLLSFYYRRSHWGDWVTSYRTGLAAARAAGERRGEAVMLRGLGVVYSDLHQFATAIDCHERAQQLLEEVADVHGQAWNLNNLGVVHVELGRLAAATGCFHRALPMFRDTGDRQGEGFCLNNLGDTYRRLGEPAHAIAYLTEALTVQRGSDDRAGLQFTLGSLADVYRDAANYDLAVSSYRQAIAISRALGDQRTLARTLAKLAITYDELGEPLLARDLRQEADEIEARLSQ